MCRKTAQYLNEQEDQEEEKSFHIGGRVYGSHEKIPLLFENDSENNTDDDVDKDHKTIKTKKKFVKKSKSVAF